MKLFDAMGRTPRAVRQRRGAKREWCRRAEESNASLDEGGTNLFWADRYGQSIGLRDLWIAAAIATLQLQRPGDDRAGERRQPDDRA
jgi:hypothetical protein